MIHITFVLKSISAIFFCCSVFAQSESSQIDGFVIVSRTEDSVIVRLPQIQIPSSINFRIEQALKSKSDEHGAYLSFMNLLKLNDITDYELEQGYDYKFPGLDFYDYSVDANIELPHHLTKHLNTNGGRENYYNAALGPNCFNAAIFYGNSASPIRFLNPSDFLEILDSNFYIPSDSLNRGDIIVLWSARKEGSVRIVKPIHAAVYLEDHYVFHKTDGTSWSYYQINTLARSMSRYDKFVKYILYKKQWHFGGATPTEECEDSCRLYTIHRKK